MEHCDPEALAVSALGEPALDARDAAHLMDCAPCAAELAALRRTVDLARGPGHDHAMPPSVAPPDRVWAAVAAELRIPATTQVGHAADLRFWHSRRLRWLGVAAAAVFLAGVSGATGALLWGDGGDAAPTTRLLAEAALQPLRDDAAGSASWLDTSDGNVLQVRVSGLSDVPVSSDYLEVWLIDPTSDRMLSLGALPASARDGQPTDLRVPEGIAFTDYSLVDVSAEPLDGDPTHSGISLTRGGLTPVN